MTTVTFTTDFGDGSNYAAALKGAVLHVNPAARLLDLTHRLPPQDLASAAWFLADTLPYFPARTIHVIVVDPGVGTNRVLLCVEWAGQLLLVPDNGCWTPLVKPGDAVLVRRLENDRFWRPEVSMTFHGRDILAPAAGHLSLGVATAELGPEVTSWISLTLPQPEVTADSVHGEVVAVDSFGNLITNIPANSIPPGSEVRIDGVGLVPWARVYGENEPGALVALIGSGRRLEIAVVNGSAAVRLGLGIGEPVEVVRNG